MARKQENRSTCYRAGGQGICFLQVLTKDMAKPAPLAEASCRVVIFLSKLGANSGDFNVK